MVRRDSLASCLTFFEQNLTNKSLTKPYLLPKKNQFDIPMQNKIQQGMLIKILSTFIPRILCGKTNYDKMVYVCGVGSLIYGIFRMDSITHHIRLLKFRLFQTVCLLVPNTGPINLICMMSPFSFARLICPLLINHLYPLITSTYN